MEKVICERVNCISNNKCYTERAIKGECTNDEIELNKEGICEFYEHYSEYPD